MRLESQIETDGGVNPIETNRLVIRPLTLEDAPFILELVNDPSYIQNIGDRGLRTIGDAEAYIRSGPMESHKAHGFGLDCVNKKTSGRAMGICGLLKRPFLDCPDLGYAFLPDFRSKGYAREAVRAVLDRAAEKPGLNCIAAIVNPDNESSIRLLTDVGFGYKKRIRPDKDKKEVRLYLRRL